MVARLQRLWTLFAVTVVTLAAIGALVSDAESTVPAALPVLLVLALGGGALAAMLVVERGLLTSEPADDAAAGEEVRARLALQIAIAEAPTLLAFALTFALGPRWVVLVGGAVSLGLLLRVRPTRRRLETIEASWRRMGSQASVLQPPDDRTP
jgi:hypothetical protein